MEESLDIRECESIGDLTGCVRLQKAVFGLPDIEISPVRHLVVTKSAGGFTLGAFAGGELIGFVLSVPAVLRGERAFYSHMTAVSKNVQGTGVGAKLKWAQRTRALAAGVRYIKWTFEPWKARNAFFNLEKLGAAVKQLQPDFYGIDLATADQSSGPAPLASDRLFAEWDLQSPKVTALAAGEKFAETREPAARIAIATDWDGLVKSNAHAAFEEQIRIRREFTAAFDAGLAGEGFERGDGRAEYLLFKDR